MIESVNSCTDCSLKSTAVSVLNKTELDQLEKGCMKNTFGKGELIFKEGNPVEYIVYVRNGFVKLSKRGIGGKEHILSISKTGSYLGIQNLNRKSNTNYFSAYALTESEVCFINTACFRNLLQQNGHFATEVITTIFDDEIHYFDRLVNNIQQQLHGRLAGALLYFRNQIYNENPFYLTLTKSELASLIGTSRESVSRILKEFRETGIVEIRKKWINILDEAKLEEIKQKG